MEGSSVGAALTPSVMSAGTIGSVSSWSQSAGAAGMTVGAHHVSLPVSVSVNGTTYNSSHATQSMAYDNGQHNTAIVANFPGNANAVTVSGYITLGPPSLGFAAQMIDLICIFNLQGHFAVLQFNPGNTTGNGTGYGLHLHSDGNGIIISPDIIVTPGATYWYTMKADYTAGKATLNLYDTSGNFVGTQNIVLQTGAPLQMIFYGNNEIGTSSGHTTYFEDTLIDYTHAAFPLVPGAGSPPPPPPPPPTGKSCDLNSDGSVNVKDVQLCVNQALGAASCTTGDVNGDGSCNVLDVQKVVNGALGGTCP